MPSASRTCGLGRIVVASVVLCGAEAAARVERGDIWAMQGQAQRMLEAERTGTSRDWRNDATGATGTIRIVSTDHTPGRQPCRRYEWTIVSDAGERVTASGNGCRISRRTWTLQEERSRVPALTPPPTPAPTPTAQSAPRPTPPAPTPVRRAPAVEDARPTAEAAPAAPPATAAPADPLEDLVFTRPPRSAADAADGG